MSHTSREKWIRSVEAKTPGKSSRYSGNGWAKIDAPRFLAASLPPVGPSHDLIIRILVVGVDDFENTVYGVPHSRLQA
jgi:hypothetical protein